MREFNSEKMRAWASGLFEGEGCITICKVKGRKHKDGAYTYPDGRKYPRLCMSLTDIDILKKFQYIVDGTISKKPSLLPSKKLLWFWSAQGKEALNAIKIFLPYLGLRRRKKLAQVFGIK